MKSLATLLIVGIATLPSWLNAEIMESLKTRDGREYLKVEIMESDDVGLKIRHDAGTARIPFEKLPDDLREKYHFNAEKAAAQKAKENMAQLQHEQIQPSESASDAMNKAPSATGADAAKGLDFAPAADGLEIEKLEAYIVGMKLKLETAQKKSVDLRAMAKQEKSRTRTINQGVDKKGHSLPSKVVPDKVGFAKAKRYEAEAAALDLQIERARVMIGIAEAKYTRLNGGEAPPEPAAIPNVPSDSHIPPNPSTRRR